MVVDGEPITVADLEYALQVEHRREDLSTTGALDINQYVQKLIDDRLIVQEARRMGMYGYPSVQKKVQAYVLRESVVRLYREEVLDKVTASDEEIADYYKDNYQRFLLDFLEFNSKADAEKMMEKLRAGERFETFIDTYRPSFSKKEGSDYYILTKKSLGDSIREAVSGLPSGAFSNVVEKGDKYYIIKLIGTEEAPDDKLADISEGIANSIRKEKIKERSDEYLKELHEKRSIEIDRELLSSISLNEGDSDHRKWTDDNRPLVKINGEVLTVGKFAAMLSSDDEKAKEGALKKWLDVKVVDLEALDRRYAEKTDLRDMVRRYESQVMKNEFSKNVIIPEIRLTEEDLKEYYLNNKEDYRNPARYKIQQITLEKEEEAQDVLQNLERGANFTWLAKTRSIDGFAEKGGVAGWQTKDMLSEPLKEIIDSLEPGDISAILEIDSRYRIVRMLEKEDGKTQDFSEVRTSVHKSVFLDIYRQIFEKYIDKLRKEAPVEINEEAIQSFESRFK